MTKKRNSLTSALTNALTPDLISSLGDETIEDVVLLPVTDGLQFHITSFQSDKTKAELVTTNIVEQVSVWIDLSGNDSDATQLTISNRPVYAEGVINGHPALNFTRNNSNHFQYDGSFLVGTDYTVFIVEQRTSDDINNYLIGGDTSSVVNSLLHLGYREDNIITHAQFFNDYNVPVNNFSSPIPRIHAFTYSSVTGKNYYQNGVLQGSKTDSDGLLGLVAYVNARIGRLLTTEHYQGAMGEIIMYDRAITSEEREEVEEYLSTKWNINLVTLPAISGLQLQITTFQLGKVKNELVTVDGGNAVSAWIDLSGNNNDAVQLTANDQPIYTDNLLNGNPAIVFDGISDFFEATGIGAIANNPYTIFLIVSPEIRVVPTYDNIIGWYDASFNNASLIMASGDPTPGSLIQFDTDLEFLINDSIADEVNVISITLNSANTSCWKNGVFQNTVIDTFTVTATQSLIGADFDPPGTIGNFFQGKMGEIIVYDRVLSTEERQIVEFYLSTKWDVTLD